MLRLSLLRRNEKLSTLLYVSWESRVYFYSAKDLKNIFSFYGNGEWMREIRIMNICISFYFFLFLSCEDEFGGVTKRIFI